MWTVRPQLFVSAQPSAEKQLAEGPLTEEGGGAGVVVVVGGGGGGGDGEPLPPAGGDGDGELAGDGDPPENESTFVPKS